MLKDHWDQEDRLRDIDEYDETGEIKKESVIDEFVLKTQIGPTGFKPKESFGTLKLNTYSINIYILFYFIQPTFRGRADKTECYLRSFYWPLYTDTHKVMIRVKTFCTRFLMSVYDFLLSLNIVINSQHTCIWINTCYYQFGINLCYGCHGGRCCCYWRCRHHSYS